MANHGLTRVECRGNKVVVVAGAVPKHVEDAAVASEPVHTPMTPVKHIPKTEAAKAPAKPPKFVAKPKPQADVKENESGS